MKFSDILSKNVISLYDGSNEGIIISGYFDKYLKKLIALEIASNDDFYNESDSDNDKAINNTQANTNANQANEQILADEFILYVKNIYSIGQDAITIKNNANLELKMTADNLIKFSPINCQAFSTNGKLLGRITDIKMDDKFNIVSYLFADNTCLEANKIASHSKGTIIFYDEDFKTKVDKLRPNGKAQIRTKNAIVLKAGTLPKTYILPTTTPVKEMATAQPQMVVNDFDKNNTNMDKNLNTTQINTTISENGNIEEKEESKPKSARKFFTLLFKGKHSDENNTNTLQKFEDDATIEKGGNKVNSTLSDSSQQIQRTATNPQNPINNNEQFINLNATTANSLQMQRPLTNANIQRLTANSNLLIGKKITRTIATQNGELIGKKGNLVTNKTIYLATAHQKLRELVLYCE